MLIQIKTGTGEIAKDQLLVYPAQIGLPGRRETMCTVCGCGQGETRIEGQEQAHREADGALHGNARQQQGEYAHGHGHYHRHADGIWHTHAHEHDGAHDHEHAGEHDRPHDETAANYGAGPAGAHAPGMSPTRMVRIEQDILAKNNAYAQANRRAFADRGIFAVNLVSSPGSGKTTLLVKTIEALKGRFPIAVIEGDQQTSVDAERIRATGAPAIQVNTGKGCHLDAHMVGHALGSLAPADDSLLMIENVGNLVCPAEFDLGEAHKVVILSVTEGEDKPLKYPNMFRAADLMLLNKIDLLPHLAFDLALCIEYAKRVNPRMAVIQLSATCGTGMAQWLDWLDWLEAGLARARSARTETVEQLRRRVAALEAQLAGRTA
jgi:hydrogenase nickel incorporation protein HypB